MVGLGVMGRNLVWSITDHSFSAAGYDKKPAKVAALRQEAKQREAHGAAGGNPVRVRPHCSDVAASLEAGLILRQTR